MLEHTQQVQQIRDHKLIGIIRAETSAGLEEAIHAMVRGGLRVLEVTLGTPGALSIIRKIRPFADDQGILFGAGTVLDSAQATMAMDAGAEFIVSPVLREGLIRTCVQRGRVVIPGCATPTEMLDAWTWGADFVKVFPVNCLGGPGYIRSVRGPLPQLRLVPTGAIRPGNLGDYLAAGAAAVGSGHVIDGQALREGNLELITARCRALVAAVAAYDTLGAIPSDDGVGPQQRLEVAAHNGTNPIPARDPSAPTASQRPQWAKILPTAIPARDPSAPTAGADLDATVDSEEFSETPSRPCP